MPINKKHKASYKFGICGHFGEGLNLLNGQTIKTKIVTDELEKVFGENQIFKVDSHNWKQNPVKLFINCFLLVKRCENIIVLPAHNGVKIFIPLFLILNWFFYRKLHYIVIGGWLPELLKKNNKLQVKVSKFDGIYVETSLVIEELKRLGINNTYLFTNFKQLKILNEDELVYNDCPPYKLCTFSRVTDMKGIEDAIEVIKKINESTGRVTFTLDIYGPVDKNYKLRFDELRATFPDYIQYKGSIGFNDSTEVLKDYFLLLFPTRYKTEGIPGTIIDAYAAGVPVIASEWNSAREIVNNRETGLVYSFRRNDELEKCLQYALENPNNIQEMKLKCLNKAVQYSPDVVIEKFIKDALQ